MNSRDSVNWGAICSHTFWPCWVWEAFLQQMQHAGKVRSNVCLSDLDTQSLKANVQKDKTRGSKTWSKDGLKGVQRWVQGKPNVWCRREARMPGKGKLQEYWEKQERKTSTVKSTSTKEVGSRSNRDQQDSVGRTIMGEVLSPHSLWHQKGRPNFTAGESSPHVSIKYRHA